MLLAPRYADIDLPVYGKDVDIICRDKISDIETVAKSDTFVRAVQLQAPDSMGRNLTEILRRTDEDLAEIARLCGARILEHSWGLHRTDQSVSDVAHVIQDSVFIQKDHPALPKNHIIVAEVPLLQNVTAASRHAPISTTRQINKGLAKYYTAHQDDHVLWDMHPGQFMIHEDDDEKITLVDIEPSWH